MTTPRSHAAILKDVKRVNDKIRKATDELNISLVQRRALYLEARDLARPDPVSYRALAEAAGTTEGAVMHVVRKGLNDASG